VKKNYGKDYMYPTVYKKNVNKMTSKWLPFSHLDLRKENSLHVSAPHQTLLLYKGYQFCLWIFNLF